MGFACNRNYGSGYRYLLFEYPDYEGFCLGHILENLQILKIRMASAAMAAPWMRYPGVQLFWPRVPKCRAYVGFLYSCYSIV